MICRTGCLALAALHMCGCMLSTAPLYRDAKDTVFEPGLPGTWREVTGSKSPEFPFKFEKGTRPNELVITQAGERRSAQLVKIGEHYFLDITVNRGGKEFHMPVLLAVVGADLVEAPVTNEWLGRYAQKYKPMGAGQITVRDDGDVVFGGTSDNLRGLLEALPAEPFTAFRRYSRARSFDEDEFAQLGSRSQRSIDYWLVVRSVAGGANLPFDWRRVDEKDDRVKPPKRFETLAKAYSQIANGIQELPVVGVDPDLVIAAMELSKLYRSAAVICRNGGREDDESGSLTRKITLAERDFEASLRSLSAKYGAALLMPDLELLRSFGLPR